MSKQQRNANIFSEIFLSRAEKDEVAAWQYKVECPGIFSFLLNPFYNQIVRYIPRTVSPNVLSFTGLLMSIFAWQISCHPVLTPVHLFMIGTAIALYMILDDIDGKHSRNTLNSSPLGELVDHFCDCITNGLLTTAVCHVFGISDVAHIWLMVLFTGTKFALEHLLALTDPEKTLRFGRFTGPTEILVLTIGAVYARDHIVRLVGPNLPLGMFGMAMVLFVQTVLELVYVAHRHYRTHRDYSTLFGILVCLLCQLLKYHLGDHDRYIENGIVFSTLTADLIIAKMAGRQLHQLIPVFHILSVVFPITSIPLALLYFVINVYDISSHMKISVVNPVRNVFVSGYYDGLHEGHIASLLKASRFGSKLTVGIHSDEDYQRTKYNPERQNQLMHKQIVRASAVANLPFVDQVIPNCPLTVTPEFLRQHKIHAVGISDEYVYETDSNTGRPSSVQKDYTPVLEKLVVIPRTEGISSSELRKNNINSFDEFRKIESLVREIGAKMGALPNPDAATSSGKH